MSTVWINEIHYDNSGADVGEAVEIAGIAGTVLDGFKLELYNGGTGSVYSEILLAGTIPDQQNGFGSLAFTISGIQNGSPDGIALADATSTSLQFLSYEGSFTAVGGSADGMTSIDILVEETTSSPLGSSLQLLGTGLAYEDFVWSGPVDESFGFINTGQAFPSSPPPPPNSVPDWGPSWALLGIVFLGLIWRPSSRQGEKA